MRPDFLLVISLHLCIIKKPSKWSKVSFIVINPQFLIFHIGSDAQSRRPASRVFTTSIKSSSNSDFNCPDEFGYYPHPTDCSQYYVCVFGGALLESCTGGLMYSHELRKLLWIHSPFPKNYILTLIRIETCDWPRNVGCELSESVAPTAIEREVTPRIPQVQTTQPQKFRFSSPSAPASSGHGIPARVHAIPPPPQLRVAPNPVITSRGQPKFEEEKDIAEVRITSNWQNFWEFSHTNFLCSCMPKPMKLCLRWKRKNLIDSKEFTEVNQVPLPKCNEIVMDYSINQV